MFVLHVARSCPHKMDTKKLLVMNKNLPMPKQKVSGNLTSLHLTTQIGFRINIDKETQHPMTEWLTVNGKTIYFGRDTVVDYQRRYIPEECLVLGDGLGANQTNNFISSPWNEDFWLTEYPNNIRTVSDRRGWCCIMHGKQPHRDLICEHLVDNLSIFDIKNYFCYDFYNGQSQKLKNLMFRLPLEENHTDADIKKIQSKMIVKNVSEISKYSAMFCLGPWQDECLIELVPETMSEQFYVTEKTIKPIAAGMPFVIVACQKFLYRLRKMGFQTFHPYIDESYDLETSITSRVEMAVKSFFNFVKNPQNLEQIQKICNHNRKILHKIRTRYNFENHVWKKLKRFITFESCC